MRKKRKSEPTPEPPNERERLSKRLEQLKTEKRRTIKRSGKISVSKKITRVREMLDSLTSSEPLPA